MQIQQKRIEPDGTVVSQFSGPILKSAQLALLFGGKQLLSDTARINELRNAYPNAFFLGCSTAGEIFDTQVTDDTLVVTAVHFEKSELRTSIVNISDFNNSREVGEKLAFSMEKEGLVHVFVLSDGLHVNGSELVKGLNEGLPPNVTVTGGLSGDGDRFEETLVLGGPQVQSGQVVALGLYGDSLKVGYGSLGGWDSFGPERLITRSEGNVLYELDGQSALDLYKKYLGEHAKGLPATGLLFPLSLRSDDGETGVVRTILAIDEEEYSMTFAGDLPQGHYARLMKANFDRLVDGAAGAAKTSYEALGQSSPDLAILISCVGRKMVLKQRIEEEVEAVREVVGPNTTLAGFYSYGEISPFAPSAKCELHNQTMTVTTISER